MEQLPKIVITSTADQDLDAMVKEINEGLAGKARKTQVASWVLSYFRHHLLSKYIEKIRADHFDEIAHLEAVVKQMKEARGSAAPLELHDLLAPVLQKQKAGVSSRTPKRTTREETDKET